MSKCLISYYGITNETCWYPSKIESAEADVGPTVTCFITFLCVLTFIIVWIFFMIDHWAEGLFSGGGPEGAAGPLVGTSSMVYGIILRQSLSCSSF